MGGTDPVVLAELAKGRLRKKIPELQEALQSRFDIAQHGVLVAGLLAHIDALDQAISSLEYRIGLTTEPYADLIELLCTIPGVGVRIAEILIAECGVDMTVFPTVGHFVSWAAICPGTNHRAASAATGRPAAATAGCAPRSPSPPTQPSEPRTPTSPRTTGSSEAAAASSKQSALPTRHDILTAYYHIVCDRVPYRELGPDWLARRHSPEHRTRRLLKQLEALGHHATLDAAA